MLLPRKGHFELIDYEKAYAPDLSRKCGFATFLDPRGGRPAAAGLGALMRHKRRAAPRVSPPPRGGRTPQGGGLGALKSGPDIFDLRGIDRKNGARVVVRPDQYVSNVLPLQAHAELAAFFGQFLLDSVAPVR